MKKSIFLLLPVCLLVIACQDAERTDSLPQAKLPPLEKVVDCPGDGKKTITVIATKKQFSVAPPHLCAKKGDEITYKFVAGHPAGTITISAKPTTPADWLEVSNPGGAGTQEVNKAVAGDAADGTYSYTVSAIGWGTIDPMITIN